MAYSPDNRTPISSNAGDGCTAGLFIGSVRPVSKKKRIPVNSGITRQAVESVNRLNSNLGEQDLVSCFFLFLKKKKKYSPYIITHIWATVNNFDSRVFFAAPNNTAVCIYYTTPLYYNTFQELLQAIGAAKSAALKFDEPHSSC
jgi:hypothetical protein